MNVTPQISHKNPENVADELYTKLKETLGSMEESQNRDQQHLKRIEVGCHCQSLAFLGIRQFRQCAAAALVS